MTFQKIPIGFDQNTPGDKNPLIKVPNKFLGGVKVYGTQAEMYDEPTQFLSLGSTVAFIRDKGAGKPGIFIYTTAAPVSNTAPYTDISHWTLADLTDIGNGLDPKGTFDGSTFDPVTHVTDANAEAGDFYVVINSDAGEIINDPSIFNGVSTTVYSGDLMIGNGSFFDVIASSTPTLDQIRAADPTFNARIATIMDGGMPTHDQAASTVSTSKTISAVEYTSIEALLAVILYNDSLAQTGDVNTEADLLWTYAQLSAIFLDEAAITTLINARIELITTGDEEEVDSATPSDLVNVAFLKFNFYNKAEVDAAIAEAILEAGDGLGAGQGLTVSGTNMDLGGPVDSGERILFTPSAVVTDTIGSQTSFAFGDDIDSLRISGLQMNLELDGLDTYTSRAHAWFHALGSEIKHQLDTITDFTLNKLVFDEAGVLIIASNSDIGTTSELKVNHDSEISTKVTDDATGAHVDLKITSTGMTLEDTSLGGVGFQYIVNHDGVGVLNDNWVPSYRAVKAYADSVSAPAPNYGSGQEVPFMNYGGTAFQYNDDFQYNGSELYLKRFSSTTQYSTLSGVRLWIQHEPGQNITLGHEGSSATGGNSPQLSGTNSINDTAEALSIRATIGSGNDTGLIPAMTIISGQVAGNALAVRPIVGVYNSSTKVLEVAADGTISVESNLIKNVLDPVDAQDAATKAYADSVGGGAGDVTKVGTPVNNQLGIWTGDGTIKGDTNLTFNGSGLVIGTGGNSNLLNSNGLLINNNSNQLVANTSTISHFTGGGAGAIVAGYYTGAASREALLLEASLNSGQDSGAVPVTVIGSRLHTGAVVATRPTLAGYNNTTKQWEVAADGTWDFQGNLIKNIADPVDPQDTASKKYVDDTIASSAYLPLTGGTLTGQLAVNLVDDSTTTPTGGATRTFRIENDSTINGTFADIHLRTNTGDTHIFSKNEGGGQTSLTFQLDGGGVDKEVLKLMADQSATFSGDVQLRETGSTDNSLVLSTTNTANGNYIDLVKGSSSAFGTANSYGFRLSHNVDYSGFLIQGGNQAAVLDILKLDRDTGDATFLGDVDIVKANSAGLRIRATPDINYSRLILGNDNSEDKFHLGLGGSNVSNSALRDNFFISAEGGAGAAFILNYTTGNATFSGDVNTLGDVTALGDANIGGHISYHVGIDSKSANYTLVNGDNGKIIRLTGATGRTFTLPASGISAGWNVQIINSSTGTVTITSSKTINSIGSASPLLEDQYTGCTVYYDGTDFEIFGAVT